MRTHGFHTTRPVTAPVAAWAPAMLGIWMANSMPAETARTPMACIVNGMRFGTKTSSWKENVPAPSDVPRGGFRRPPEMPLSRPSGCADTRTDAGAAAGRRVVVTMLCTQCGMPAERCGRCAGSLCTKRLCAELHEASCAAMSALPSVPRPSLREGDERHRVEELVQRIGEHRAADGALLLLARALSSRGHPRATDTWRRLLEEYPPRSVQAEAAEWLAREAFGAGQPRAGLRMLHAASVLGRPVDPDAFRGTYKQSNLDPVAAFSRYLVVARLDRATA